MVLKDALLQWDLDAASGAVGRSMLAGWDVRETAKRDAAIQWGIRDVLSRDAELAWTVTNTAARELLSQWDVIQSLGRDLPLEWDMIGQVGRNLELRWRIGALVLESVCAVSVPLENRHLSVPPEVRRWTVHRCSNILQ